ncbi:glycosyltransferase [Candidatus Pelagibacter sp.]|nr:glycosyltransferase [Candidatus Pelagibacter sp.]
MNYLILIKIYNKAQILKNNNIIFLDAMPKTQLISILKSADIGMQILDNIPGFYYGTSPNKFFDYLASGLPVLNNYQGWLADLIKKHQCGFVIEPHNPKEFANKIIYAAENPMELKQMGFNAKKLAKKNFDMNILAKKFIKCFEEAKNKR